MSEPHPDNASEPLAGAPSSIRFGYTRVSTGRQDDDLQRRALLEAGVGEGNIFGDVVTGASAADSRPGWSELLRRVRPADTIVVWRVDRLGRSVLGVLTAVAELSDRGVFLVSVVDGIDATTSSGRLMLGLMSTLAEYERDLITERVRAGIGAARARGVRLGRPQLDVRKELGRAQVVADLIANGHSATEAGEVVGWSRATTYRRLALLSSQTATSPQSNDS